jgi:heptaprenyl diphosphate synthase
LTPTKKLAIIAMLVAQAAVLHFLESLLPNPIPIPGVKLGLANIITLLALLLSISRPPCKSPCCVPSWARC